MKAYAASKVYELFLAESLNNSWPLNRWYSNHWLPQSLLAVAFVANSANQKYVHARAWMIARVTGGKLCAEIYGSEWLGALIALAAINLPLG